MINHPYEKWLDRVHNPSQYIGNEVHSVIKGLDDIECRIALCFPELYSIGMSHLGLKILYSILNNDPRFWAERFYMVEPDMEERLRAEKEPLRSWESHDPLGDFDIIGFSVSTEMVYTNILAMLDIGGIPLLSRDRSDSAPLVIAGGAAIYNSEPIADFFDLFVLGEAEKLFPTLALRYSELRDKGCSKEKILRDLAGIRGVYVPSLFDVFYRGATIEKILPLDTDVPVPSRIIMQDLNESPYPYDMVIPYGQPVFDRISVEIDRGCTGACRFCQAGMTYRPVRERDPENVLQIIEKTLKFTGFDEVSLASLSSGDYSYIEPLVAELMNRTSGEHVSVSMPSMRSGTLTERLIEEIRRVRKTGFTITAEAGNERLRSVINKKISDEEVLGTAMRVLEGGWRSLKMYFMIGLPTETDGDLLSIVELVKKVDSLRSGNNRFRNINVGISQFVPKAHTPFQWVKMDSPEEMLRKKRLLLAEFKGMKSVKVKGHEVEMSFMEGIFSRGDRRLGGAVMRAYESGCRLDGWTEYFRYGTWMEAFKEAGIDPAEYALRPREKDEVLPWDHLDLGVSKKYLLRELKYSEEERVTQDCRSHSCLACGLPPNDNVLANKPINAGGYHIAKTKAKESYRYRLYYRKEGLSRYLSHIELMVAFSRAIRRALLPIEYSEGMHPHPRMSFGPALPVGVISLSEMLDMGLEEMLAADEIKSRLNSQLEQGITIYSVVRLTPPYRSIESQTERTIYEIEDYSLGLEPSLETVRDALADTEGTTVDVIREKDGARVLRAETEKPGILSGIRKKLPNFGLSDQRRLVKCTVMLKS